MQKKCFWCNKIYSKKIKTSVKQWNKSRFCSIHCKSLWLGQKFKGDKSPVWINKNREKVCEVCCRDFLVEKPCLLEKRRFCSKKCFYKNRKESIPWNQGKIIVKKCEGCSKLIRKWRKYCSKKCKDIYFIPWNKNKRYFCLNRRGENSSSWKGGKTSKDKLLRKSALASWWRGDIFKRDNYTCQICGQYGRRLNANHIEKWSESPLLRFKLCNGITLCENCHRSFVNHHENEWKSYFYFNLMVRSLY